MLVFGHKHLEAPKFHQVLSIEEVKNTPPNSIIYLTNLERDIEIVKFAIGNNVDVALYVKSIREAILAENLGVKYIVSTAELSPGIQKLADDYLFDSKHLVIIYDEVEIEEMAKLGIDGVVFSDFLL